MENQIENEDLNGSSPMKVESLCKLEFLSRFKLFFREFFLMTTRMKICSGWTYSCNPLYTLAFRSSRQRRRRRPVYVVSFQCWWPFQSLYCMLLLVLTLPVEQFLLSNPLCLFGNRTFWSGFLDA